MSSDRGTTTVLVVEFRRVGGVKGGAKRLISFNNLLLYGLWTITDPRHPSQVLWSMLLVIYYNYAYK